MYFGKIMKNVCLLLLFVTIAGCASYKKQAFNKNACQDVKMLGILDPAHKDEYVIANLGHAGIGFGLIGGLIAAADMNSKTNSLTTLMKERGFDITEEFKTSLASELQGTGYAVKAIKVQREKTDYLENYRSLDQDVDAYLDLTLLAGYMCASSTADYIPVVRSKVRLVKRESGDILYEDIISYGYEYKAAEAISIAAEQLYSFGNFSAIKENPDRAMEGLRKGVPLVSRRIAQDLAKR